MILGIPDIGLILYLIRINVNFNGAVMCLYACIFVCSESLFLLVLFQLYLSGNVVFSIVSILFVENRHQGLRQNKDYFIRGVFHVRAQTYTTTMTLKEARTGDAAAVASAAETPTKKKRKAPHPKEKVDEDPDYAALTK